MRPTDKFSSPVSLGVNRATATKVEDHRHQVRVEFNSALVDVLNEGGNTPPLSKPTCPSGFLLDPQATLMAAARVYEILASN